MHTSEHEHVREGKREKFLFYFFFILSVSISSTVRDSQTIIFYCSRLRAFTDPIKSYCPFIRIRVAVAFGRPRKKPRIHDLNRTPIVGLE